MLGEIKSIKISQIEKYICILDCRRLTLKINHFLCSSRRPKFIPFRKRQNYGQKHARMLILRY